MGYCRQYLTWFWQSEQEERVPFPPVVNLFIFWWQGGIEGRAFFLLPSLIMGSLHNSVVCENEKQQRTKKKNSRHSKHVAAVLYTDIASWSRHLLCYCCLWLLGVHLTRTLYQPYIGLPLLSVLFVWLALPTHQPPLLTVANSVKLHLTSKWLPSTLHLL